MLEGYVSLFHPKKNYRYEPAFLFERKYSDVNTVIERLYDECIADSLLLGIYFGGEFCGIFELYSFNDSIHKISVGYRLREKFWGQGIASEALKLMIDYLYTNTDIEIITASTLPDNQASEKVLRKNGFELVIDQVIREVYGAA
jgi:RimJ/RimL family protein N-acetyltransferase